MQGTLGRSCTGDGATERGSGDVDRVVGRNNRAPENATPKWRGGTAYRRVARHLDSELEQGLDLGGDVETLTDMGEQAWHE